MPVFDRLKRAWAVWLILLIPLIPLHRAVFLGEAIGPYDQIRQMAPWNAEAPVKPWDVLQSDSVLQSAAWRKLVIESWSHFNVPVWNPYQLGGAPLLQNSQSGALYPPHIVLGMAQVPPNWAGTFLAWFHLFWLGLGIYRLVRKHGGSEIAGAVGAVCAQLSAFAVAWTALASVPATISWIPWVIGGAYAVFDREQTDSAAWGSSLGFAVSVGMLFLAGHLQFAAYGLFAAALVSVGLLISLRNVKRCGPLLAGLVLGLLIALPQLEPVLEWGKESHRKVAPSAEGYQAQMASALKPVELARWVHPILHGAPWQSDASIADANVSTYWPAREWRGANFAEGAVGMSILLPILIGCCVGLRRPRNWIPLAVVGIFGLLLALGTAVNMALYYGVPGWASTGSPGRAIVLFVLPCAALAGLGVDPLIERLKRKHAEAGIVAAAVLLGLAWTPWNAVPTGKPLEAAGTPNPNQRIAAINSGWDLLVAAPAILPPNTATLMGLSEIAGYDSLLDRGTKAMLDDINGGDSAPPANGNIMFIKPSASLEKLREAGVTEVWSRIPMRDWPIQPARMESNYAVYEIGGPGKISVNGKPVKILEESPEGVTFEVEGPGKLVMRYRHHNGMELLGLEGAKLEGAVWCETELPAGTHRLTLRYTRSLYVRPTFDILFIALFVLAICQRAAPWLFETDWRKRKTVVK